MLLLREITGVALGGWSPSSSQNNTDGNKVHIVGSSVNLPDMSATLKTKIAVSEEAQQDPRLLAMAYDAMASKFSTQGFNIAAISAMRQYFSHVTGPGEAHPLNYADFPKAPLPPGAVRLSLVFFQRANLSLANLVHRAASEVISALPKGTKIHLNDPGHYHITIYMTSQPHTLRPSPLIHGNAISGNLTPEELYQQAQPTNFEGELAVLRKETSTTSPPTFKVHRLLMADSGTLLLCSVDISGTMAGLRRRLKNAFPGGPPRQSTIFHASVARVLSPEQLDNESIKKVQRLCDKWSERLRGMEFSVDALHYVMEERFTTVEGPTYELPLKGNTSL
ncbi:hypothetical protein NADE_008179 [Nannochloris sp. 'desiccata']|nr:hypothetical protein KSW81_000077 [Chlorella desiccata (nom. nud.)]KAH7619902.1 hypothetical protein NADE_008179 [Chlorella desiccata (nom. nud.)]